MNIAKKNRNKAAARPHPAREAALAQWRGMDLRDLEKANASTAQAIKSLMPKVLKSLGIDRRCTETEIVKVWNHQLDPNIVAHAQPTGLNKGTLFVTVDNSVWLSELVRYRRHEILERLQNSFGKDLIVRLSFRIG
jgi:predicted nucleic acid-binding Zn ribbon protein